MMAPSRPPVAVRRPVQGAGLGLRREFSQDFLDASPAGSISAVGFLEVAPENWMGIGGRRGKQFRALTERYPFVTHGLSLSLGGPAPLDEEFLAGVKQFLDQHQIRYYTEHLSYCSDDGHLYDLMPIPFTDDAVHYVAARIRRTQDLLERRIAVENVSYYAAPGAEMSELEFLTAVLTEADCALLLDVNNIYVNSINHHYDPVAFLKCLPGARIAYGHIAGHYVEAEDLRVDTHAAPVIDPVWRLLETAYSQFGVFPTLLERDFNIPPLSELLNETAHITRLQNQYAALPQAVGHG
ncbi:MAG: HvfB family MNIO-type RiPP peptide maturase [Nevskiales bacterium]